MAFLNENEWILLNEIAYNISFIYTVEEMQQEMLNRWLPFLIPYDAAIFARISTTEDGAYQFQTPAAFHLSQQAVNAWVQESLNSDAFRWVLYTRKGGPFGNPWSVPEEQIKNQGIYQNFYLPNHLTHSVGLSICFRRSQWAYCVCIVRQTSLHSVNGICLYWSSCTSTLHTVWYMRLKRATPVISLQKGTMRSCAVNTV